MSTVRWKHLTETSPVLRFGNWLFTQLGAMPLPGLSYHTLALELDLRETAPLPR